ncbi:T9SS type A sorting domain-containing protein [Bacteroidota bacterium]
MFKRILTYNAIPLLTFIYFSIGNTIAAEQTTQLPVAYTDRNYYTSETHARVLIEVPSDVGHPSDIQVTFEIKGLDSLFSPQESVTTNGEVAVRIPLNQITEGITPVRIDVYINDQYLGSQTVTINKYPPAKEDASEVKIDQENRVLLVNEKPIFPVGIVGWGGIGTESVKQFKELGFNAAYIWIGEGRGTSLSSGRGMLNLLEKNGMYGIIRPLSFIEYEGSVRNTTGLKAVCSSLPPVYNYLSYHPALLAYYGVDEPPEKVSGYDGALRQFYDTTHKYDPYHPLYFSGGGGILRYSDEGHYEMVDFYSEHEYWCPMGWETHRSPNPGSKVIKEYFENFSEPNHRPLFFLPQGEFTSHSRRALAPDERRAMVYLGIIQGAKSILYFRSPVHCRATYNSMKELSTEINLMAPALVTRKPKQKFVYTPAVETNDLPVVQCLFTDHPDGGSLLIACNSSYAPVEAEWNIASLGSQLNISDYFTGEQISLNDTIISENFSGYGTRVYLIKGGTHEPGKEVIIKVSLSGEALTAPILSVQQPSGKNMLVHSSFEESSVLGWPDSWILEQIGASVLPNLVGDPNGPGVDTSISIHGNNSLRLNSPYGRIEARYFHPFDARWKRGGIAVVPGYTYTLSMYIKSEQAGTNVKAYICNRYKNSWQPERGKSRSFRLDTIWQRYELTLTYPKNALELGWKASDRPAYVGIFIEYDKNISIWVDAVQFEKGAKATRYFKELPKFSLNVDKGNGDGIYQDYDTVSIQADKAPSRKVFDQWTGHSSFVTNPYASNTTVIIPAGDISITATYRDSITYALNVENGNGDGDYLARDTILIEADPPPYGKTFDRWLGDTKYLMDDHASSTYLIMPEGDFTITATYKILPKHGIFVENGSGDGYYPENDTVQIVADNPPSGKEFDKWTDDVEYVEDVNSPVTTVIVPEFSIIVTATYKDIVTETDHFQENAIRIYPNPTNGKLYINLTGKNARKISVSDITGKIIMEKTNLNQRESIDLSGYRGIYIVSIQFDNTIYRIKICVT